ncbi:MAG TPA: GNAT family N-acetyltransferase [Ruania sp.]|nr:GNAT family N-acetyltransferase [Ruania sp.]
MPDRPLVVQRATTAPELERVHRLRLEVFVHEQGVPPAEELDDRDHEPGAVHLLAVAGGEDLGTARLLVEEPGRVHLTRVAVSARARGLGVGRALMAFAEQIAAQEQAAGGMVRVELSAQESALGFYRALGYSIGTDRYYDAGIRHADAVKVIPGGSATGS